MLLDLTDNTAFFNLELSNSEPMVFSGDDSLSFKKQVIYTGRFGKYELSGKPKHVFTVGLSDLHHWKQSVELQLARGIKVDLPIGHTENPEASRGEITGASVEPDSKGRMSLFLTGKFRDAEAAKLGKTAQVSLFSPPKWIDGKGNTYVYPIRHLALTQNPTIPDLGGFTVSASLSDVESKPMASYLELCKKFGVKLPDGATEEQAAEALSNAPLSLKAEAGDTGTGGGATKPATSSDSAEMAFSLNDPMSKRLASLTIRDRQSQIQGLVTSGKITPAAAKKLTEKYATQDAVVLSLSGTEDGFDSVVESMSMLPSSSLLGKGERTGKQVLELSNAAGDSAGGAQESTLDQRLKAKLKAKG